jgi:hypothetical protein
MNKINQDDLFGHVSQYLKNKGVHLEEGACTRTIQKGCQVLADTINLSQQGMARAKTELEKNLQRAREVIHEKTAPKPPRLPVEGAPTAAPAQSAARGATPAKQPNRRAASKQVPQENTRRSLKRRAVKPPLS